MGTTGSEEKQSKVLSRMIMPDCMILQESNQDLHFHIWNKSTKNVDYSLVHGDVSMVFGKAYRYNQINFGEFM